MSVASDRLAAARSRMEDISREHSARRELRERKAREARDAAGEALAKQGKVAEQTIDRIQEAGRRQKAAGGWGTTAATQKKGGEYRFDTGDDEPTYQAPQPGAGWVAPPPPVSAPPPPPPVAPPPARPAPRRPAPVDDDEDFGTQSWLT